MKKPFVEISRYWYPPDQSEIEHNLSPREYAEMLHYSYSARGNFVTYLAIVEGEDRTVLLDVPRPPEVIFAKKCSKAIEVLASHGLKEPPLSRWVRRLGVKIPPLPFAPLFYQFIIYFAFAVIVALSGTAPLWFIFEASMAQSMFWDMAQWAGGGGIVIGGIGVAATIITRRKYKLPEWNFL